MAEPFLDDFLIEDDLAVDDDVPFLPPSSSSVPPMLSPPQITRTFGTTTEVISHDLFDHHHLTHHSSSPLSASPSSSPSLSSQHSIHSSLLDQVPHDDILSPSHVDGLGGSSNSLITPGLPAQRSTHLTTTLPTSIDIKEGLNRNSYSTGSFDYSGSRNFAQSLDTNLYGSSLQSNISALSEQGRSFLDNGPQITNINSSPFDTQVHQTSQAAHPSSIPASFGDALDNFNGLGQLSGFQFSLSGTSFEPEDHTHKPKQTFPSASASPHDNGMEFRSTLDHEGAVGLSEHRHEFIDMSGASVIDSDELARQRRKKKKRSKNQHSLPIEPIHRDSQEAHLILAAINSTSLEQDNERRAEKDDALSVSHLSVSATTVVHRQDVPEPPEPRYTDDDELDENLSIPPGFVRHHNAHTLTHPDPEPYIDSTNMNVQAYPQLEHTLTLSGIVAQDDAFIFNQMQAFAELHGTQQILMQNLMSVGQMSLSQLIVQLAPQDWARFVQNDPVLMQLQQNTFQQQSQYIQTPAPFYPTYPPPPATAIPTPPASLTSPLATSSTSQTLTKKPYFGQKNAVPQPTVRCFRCGQPGHSFDMCPLNQMESRKNGMRVDRNCCYKCGKPGHHSRDCPNEDIRVCFFCKQTGHVMRECPLKRNHPMRGEWRERNEAPMVGAPSVPLEFRLDAPSFVPSSTKRG
ncbi:hypothetical protein BLNAU_9033 [Blattamonas nauphoetae]|uniref:CCHC-type domain-containing protein n=1 Tax=Blattamonas nauphoetae TaxID=2049346 RepID=A0ABQ9XX30_9EUKA|nr:hypothetical protein BLNAU_9033 [Blattamonas nauphoetae]